MISFSKSTFPYLMLVTFSIKMCSFLRRTKGECPKRVYSVKKWLKWPNRHPATPHFRSFFFVLILNVKAMKGLWFSQIMNLHSVNASHILWFLQFRLLANQLYTFFYSITKNFSVFLVLSVVILLSMFFSIYNKTFKLNSKNWKRKKKVL